MSSWRFQNKVAIVTGAGQGIGFEICRQLLNEGCSVVLNDLDEELANRAAEQLNGSNSNCIVCPGSAGDINTIEKMVSLSIDVFGKLDIIIANAGITLFGDFLDYTRDDFLKVMDTNLSGTFFLAQRAAKQMIQQQRGGSMLFMSSVTGHQAHKNLAAYGMTKAAIEMLAKHPVVELSPHGINVNAVAPGATLTERTESDADYQQTWSSITPMGRPATVDDIAKAALFLVSMDARHITGQTIIIDGGWTTVSPSPYQ